MVKKYRSTLSNGLPIVVVEIPGSNSVYASFWTKAGSRYDPSGKNGTAHFMEHVLLGKTKAYPTSEALGTYLENFGIWKNGWTNKEWIEFLLGGPAKHLDKMLAILSEVVFAPVIDKDTVDQEREVIKKEIARKKSQQDLSIWEVWWKAFFAGTPMEHPNLGYPETLDKITVDDIRDYWKKYFLNKNCMLMVCGGVSVSDVKKLSQEVFGGTKLSENFDVSTHNYHSGNQIFLEKLDVPQTMIELSFRIPSKLDNDYYALQVTRYILSVGWGSRFFQRLRVKERLIYSRSSDFLRFEDTRAMVFITSTESEKLPKLLLALSDEFKKIRENLVDKEELERAINFMEGHLLTDFETSEDFTNWYGLNELHWPEDAESIEERIEGVKKVTEADILRVAKKYFRNDNWDLGVLGIADKENIKFDL